MPSHESRGPIVAIYDAAPDSYLPLIGRVVRPDRLRICTDPGSLGRVAIDAEVLLAFKFPLRPFPREEVLALPQLKWVQLASAGSDHMLPFDPARLTVTSASGIHGDTMAEYVIASVLHMLWDFPRLLRQQRERRWSKYEVPTLAGLTMGIVGAGQVGSRIGLRARAFGMRVLAVRRSGAPVEGADEAFGPDELQRVLARSDVVVITLPLTSQTVGMIDEHALSWTKRGSWFVNVSRGGIVEEDALLDLLRRGHLAGAILDVFAEEPLPPQSPFWSLPNVLVTPHISSEFAGWPLAVARLFCDNLDRWARAAPLVNVVDPALGY